MARRSESVTLRTVYTDNFAKGTLDETKGHKSGEKIYSDSSVRGLRQRRKHSKFDIGDNRINMDYSYETSLATYTTILHSAGTLTVKLADIPFPGSCIFVAPHTGTVNEAIGYSSIIVTGADGGDQATGRIEEGTTISSDGVNVTITWDSDNALGASWTGSVKIFSNTT